jgi:hypothetical protein
MKVEIHSLSWPNADPRLAESQAAVFSRFCLPIRQHCLRLDHGTWIDLILEQSSSDVLLFVDNDCVPIRPEAVFEAVHFAYSAESFLGLAQASNHIGSGNHVFAAPSFLAVSRSAWVRLGRPSCCPNARADVAEELSWRAEESNLVYRAWYPTHYHHASSDGPWRLGHYGYFGIGSVYADRVVHLYQGRLSDHVDLFVDICSRILADSFTLDGYQSCLSPLRA